MCLLTFFPAGVMPDCSALLNGAYLNNHGHGFAIVAADRIIVQKGIDAEPLVDAFDTLRRQHQDGPALFHSRFATHGEHGIDNCHPFPVGGDPRTVLAHNGILPTIVQPNKDDPRSDTRIAAEQFIPSLGPLRLRRVRRRIERWMTDDNLIVILTVDPRFKQRAYILNENSGIWDDGIWYSNDGYLPPEPTRWRTPYEPHWHWPPWTGHDTATVCGFCQAIIDPIAGECPYCAWCVDCQQTPGDCQCYSPAMLDTRYGAPAPRQA